MKAWIARFIDRQSKWVATWLHGRSAFVLLVYGTLLWIPLVALGIDHNGFWYLYVATSLSLVTQAPLAWLAARAAQEAAKNEELTRQSLKNQADTLKLLLAQYEAIEDDVERIVEEIHDHGLDDGGRRD